MWRLQRPSCFSKRLVSEEVDREATRGAKSAYSDPMTEKRMARPLLSIIEEKIRDFWSRLGAAIERSIGPRSQQPFDVAGILDAVERAIESGVRRENGRLMAANRIELRFDYETYSKMSDRQRRLLVRELEASLTEFVHNRRYSTSSPLRIDLAFDPFVRHLDIKTNFSGETNLRGPAPVSIPTELTPVVIRLRAFKDTRAGELEGAFAGDRKTLALGRSRDNALVIEDSSVSNFHAAFTLNPDRSVWLSDLGSSNGTSIAGVPLAPNDRQQVSDGEILRFGDIDMKLELSISRNAEK